MTPIPFFAIFIALSAHAAVPARDLQSLIGAKLKRPAVQLAGATASTATTGAEMPQIPSIPVDPIPLRFAKMRVTIQKTTLTKNPTTGTFDAAASHVCTLEVPASVYDQSTTGVIRFGEIDNKRVQCASTIGGQTVSVNLGGALVIGKANMFGTDETYKIGIAFLWFEGSVPSSNLRYGAGVTGSTDVRAKSLLSSIQPPNDPFCVSTPPKAGLPCTPAVDEVFSAIVDFED